MRGLLPAAMMCAACVVGAAGAAPPALTCTPALRYYCANIHIGCAGRSRVATAPFTLLSDGDRHRVIRATARQSGHGVWSERSMVIRMDGTRDWIRLELGRDGRYRFAERIYRNGSALMSRGACTPG